MSSLSLPGSLVNVQWLYENIHSPDLIIFDASWHMPGSGRNGLDEWRKQRIGTARFFDFDQTVCRPDCDLPHMMPNAAHFSHEAQKLGLNQDSVVVVYDSVGMFSSPRVWWMLKSMGVQACAVLNGGLPAWQSAGYPVATSMPDAIAIGNFIAQFEERYFCDVADVQQALNDDAVTIIDARSGERFRGEVEEPRPGLRRGHMPGAVNLPFPQLFDQGVMKSNTELRSTLSAYIPAGQHVISSCGTGVTACVIALGAHLAGYDDVSVYDGSWSEWGLPGDLPVER